MNKYEKIIDTAINIVCPGSRCTISKILEESVKDLLINKYGENWRDNEELFFNAFNNLRTNFNMNAYTGDIPYLYAMYYMFLNVPKIELILLQLMKRKRLHKELKILDIGCSVGTTSAAILDLFTLFDNLCTLFNENKIVENITVDSIEGSKENIEVFNKNLKFYQSKLSEITKVSHIKINEPKEQDILNYDIKGKYDIVIISNVLNEIPYLHRKKLILNLEKNLTTSGEIILVEPASKSSSIALNKLKYEICEMTKLQCIAPCGTCSECNDNCWTFRENNIINGELVSYIDNIYEKYHDSKFKEFYNNRLKWSYCIFSNNIFNDKCTKINNLDNNNISNVKGYIVKRTNNLYTLCDAYGNKYEIVSTNGNLGNLTYGDYIEFKDISLSKDSIIIKEDSTIINLYNTKQNEKYRYKDIDIKNIEFILRRLWGYKKLRDGQFDIISKALEGKDILGILPTGAGKSICYQLPAMLGNGVSIVVSPLKSLIKDQVHNLQKVGFEFVDYIDSSKSAEEKAEVLSRFKAGSLKILYLSPERLQMVNFQNELKESLKDFNIDYFIVDEAHCASEWGHDFRPAYLKLKDVKNKMGDCNILAVTATASPKVKEDVLDIFNIKEENVINSKSLDRKEISLEVVNLEQGKSKDDFLRNYVSNKLPEILNENKIEDIHEDGAGLIFTIYANSKGSTTKFFSTEHIRDVVQSSGIKANLYHSKLNDKLREDIQDDFIGNKFPVLVSTKGFGMGIDKPNIRYILHMCYSNSLEAYYQEAGRAGRDGEHAHSVIIATSRSKECEKSFGSIDSCEPPCIDGWTCKFTEGVRCDYGMQAKFISGQYPTREVMRVNIFEFYNKFFLPSYQRRAYETKKTSHKFMFFVPEHKLSEYQKYLYYFQKFDFIVNYHIVDYQNNGARLGVEISDSFNKSNPNAIINEIVDKIIDRLQEFKKQKYNMLQVMWTYVSQDKQCRREFLMQYFGNDANYGEEGCKFCDVEGISEDQAIMATSTLRIKKLYDEINDSMRKNTFDLNNLKDLILESEREDLVENVKIRALRFLEDYTDNVVALFLASTITLKSDNSNAFARNQAYQLIEQLRENKDFTNIIKVFDHYLDIDDTVSFKILSENFKINNDLDLLARIINESSNKEWAEVVYKSYTKNKLNQLNKLFERRK